MSRNRISRVETNFFTPDMNKVKLKDKNLKPHWARMENVELKKAQGYIVVPRGQAETFVASDGSTSSESGYRRGDMILMANKKEWVKARRKYLDDLTDELSGKSHKENMEELSDNMNKAAKKKISAKGKVSKIIDQTKSVSGYIETKEKEEE